MIRGCACSPTTQSLGYTEAVIARRSRSNPGSRRRSLAKFLTLVSEAPRMRTPDYTILVATRRRTDLWIDGLLRYARNDGLPPRGVDHACAEPRQRLAQGLVLDASREFSRRRHRLGARRRRARAGLCERRQRALPKGEPRHAAPA